MFRKLIIIIFLVFLSSGCVTFDLESARQAYESGDYKTVTELLIPLAEAGDAEAQTDLGFMYANGLGVPQDYTEAVKWYRKAAEQGDALAQYNLGVRYAEGRGVTRDYVQAYAWIYTARLGGNTSGLTPAEIASKMFPEETTEATELAKEYWEKFGNKTNH